jgi:hypothetical protein
MPWIFLVQGTSLRVATDSPYSLEDDLLGSGVYKRATEQAEKHGFIVRTSSNSEHPIELAVIVGKDLYPNGHIYQGLTITAPVPDVELSELEAIVADLIGWLKEATGTAPDIEHGIILNQFD